MLTRNNTPAPSFSLRDSEGTLRSLDELRSQNALVLLFFRGAFCPTAHRDLLAYGDALEHIHGLNAGLVAVSADDPEELGRLKEGLRLNHLEEHLKTPFPLLSDADFSVSRTYGIYSSDETESGPQPHGEPAVFVLDKQGRIIFSQIQSGPKGTAPVGDVLQMLAFMQENDGHYWDSP